MGNPSEQSSPHEEVGTDILQFPSKQPGGGSSDSPSPALLIHQSPEPMKSLAHEDAEVSANVPLRDIPTSLPVLRKVDPAPSRPPRRRFVTERPLPAQRTSLLHMRRNKTAYKPGAFGKVATARKSEDTTSSDEENLTSLVSPSSHLSGRAGSKKQHNNNNYFTNTDFQEGQYGAFSINNDDYQTKGRVSKRDGRLNISVNETNNRGYLAHALGATLQKNTKDAVESKIGLEEPLSPSGVEDTSKRPELLAKLSTISTTGFPGGASPQPKLNIVIMVIGSRGDIQPFLKVGKLLKEDYGHRVRIATHPAFKEFVEQDSKLEFFSVGGDPAELMAFMVKNPGLIPSVSTVRAGEIGRKRDSMFEMFQGFWRACINTTDDEHEASNLRMMSDKHPFVADAIIANPPCFAHVHCAERLGVPLHLMFTFPYSPTQQFPHPLANIKKSNVDSNYTNFMSYPLVEMMTWQGLGDLVNRFRVKTLGLEPVSTLWAPGQLFRQKVPYTYLWSPGLIPKPSDWGPEIDIAGFVFLDLASSFKPPDALTEFLEAGEPPVYIGFGSIVIDDPDNFTSLIFEAVKKAGVRALVSKGWGGLGDESSTPNNIYMLENTPHDWLFPRCSAVVHHGGAGTTAIGLKCGKPTMIVPFFGDQPFWGAMVARAGAGADEATPYKRLSSDKLAEGIQQCLKSQAIEAATKIAKSIASEGDGAKNAVESFHRHLPTEGDHSMLCSILPDHVAAWTLKESNLRLSALAAELLIEQKKITWRDLRLVRHHEWNDFEGPGEPFTGAGAALVSSAGAIFKGVGGMPVRWAKSIKKEKRDQRAKGVRNLQTTDRGSTEKDVRNADSETNGSLEHSSAENSENDTGELPNGGQHGMEKYLPESHGLLGNAHKNSEKESIPVGSVLRRAPSKPQGCETEDAALASSTASDENLAQHLMEDTGHGFAKSGEAFAKAPMDLSLAIAQGFHNAPRLYGDSTVRTPPRISGIQSGLRAAGSEFTFGVYDGVTGLFLQPYHGAREHGVLGLVHGVGKGLGGFVLKDLAAIFGPFGYTMKGIHKELIKGRQPTAFIRKARQLQGEIDVASLGDSRRQRELIKIDTAWTIVNETRKEDEAQKREGMKGRLTVFKDHQRQTKSGGFENVRHARKALDAKQEKREKRKSLAMAINRGDGSRTGSKISSKKTSLSKLAGRKSVTEKEARQSMDEKTAIDDETARNTTVNRTMADMMLSTSMEMTGMDGSMKNPESMKPGRVTNGSANFTA